LHTTNEFITNFSTLRTTGC